MKIKIDIENKDNVIAELEEIISMAEELKYNCFVKRRTYGKTYIKKS